MSKYKVPESWRHNWKITDISVENNNVLKFNNLSKQDLCRLKYLARKMKRNIKGLVTQLLLDYIKNEK